MHTPPLVLIVDDEENFREVFMKELASLGFDARGASNGADAVKKAAELKPDLILMDIKMPGEMNGVDAALRIKGDPETRDIKIAFLSSAENPWPALIGNKADVSKSFGMEDFISKSEDLDVFVAKVKGFLGAA
jgi:CheY-like chemotaxis protein